MSTPKLIYFPVNGRGEAIRALLNHAKFAFEDCRMSKPEFAPLQESGHSPMGGCPIWEEDGFVQCQGNSILRVLGIRLGYYSEDAETCYNIDSLMDFAEDLQPSIGQYLFPVQFGRPHGDRQRFLDGWFRKHMKVCGDRLASHGKPFLAGTDRPTIADFKMFA